MNEQGTVAQHAPEDLCVALDWQGLRAFPALQTEEADGWVLRASGGINRRVDSATALNPRPADLDGQIDRVRRFFGACSQPALIRFPDIWPTLEQQLTARGWTAFRPCFVMHKQLQDASAALPTLEELARGPWMDFQVAAKGFSVSDRATLERIFDLLKAPAHYLAMRDAGGDLVGAALLTADSGGFGLQKVIIPPERRGRGLGRELMDRVLLWAATRGSFMWLQVQQVNAPAVALYRALGFDVAYSYRYWEQTRAAGGGP